MSGGTTKPKPPPPGLSRLPFVLLGLLTLFTAGGPVAILLTLRGGARRQWPPDRPLEWWTFGFITGAVIVLMTACIAIGLVRWWRTPRYSSPPPPPES